MKLWIGAETQADAVDVFRPVRADMETAINAAIRDCVYDLGVDDWDCIVILRDDGAFEERVRFSKKTRDMDFRLRLNYKEFIESDTHGRQRLLFSLLLRSLKLLAERGGNRADIDRFTDDISRLGQERNWL